MRYAIWTEVRRSPLRWWLPVLVSIDLAMLFGRSTDWIGIWPQASAAAQVPIFYVSLLLAAGSAYAAGRVWRTQTLEQFSATALPTWRSELVHLISTVLYGFIPLVIGSVVAAATSYSRDAGPGFLWPSYLLLGVSLLVVGAAAGHLCGRLIQSRITAPLTAVAVVFALVSLMPGGLLQLMVLSGAPQVQFEPAALATRVMFALAIVFAAIVVSMRRKVVTAVLAGVVVLVTATSAAVAGPLRTYRQPPAQPLCADTKPVVCVWPEHKVLLPKVVTIAERFGELPDVVKLPDGFYEEGLRAPIGQNSDFPLVFGDWAAARAMSSSVLNETLGFTDCMPPSDEKTVERNINAWIEIKEWLVARAYGPKPSDVHGGFEFDEAELNRVLSTSDDQQAAWIAERIATIEETRCA